MVWRKKSNWTKLRNSAKKLLFLVAGGSTRTDALICCCGVCGLSAHDGIVFLAADGGLLQSSGDGV